MKANRNPKLRNDKAEVGIGTLIVFIAMILVAAVAAAVVVNTSGLLQSRALSTGKASSDQVGSSVKVIEIYANRSTTSGELKNLTAYVQLSPGANPVDLDDLWIFQIGDGATRELTKAAAPTTTRFTVSFPLQVTANSILESGEIAKLHWALDMATNERVILDFHPEAGGSAHAEFYLPGTFGALKDFKVF